MTHLIRRRAGLYFTDDFRFRIWRRRSILAKRWVWTVSMYDQSMQGWASIATFDTLAAARGYLTLAWLQADWDEA